MAFERTVRMPNEQICTWHEVRGITQLVDTSTWIEVASWEDKDARDNDRASVRTSLLHDFVDGMTVADAEEIAKTSTEFEEYVDPTQAMLDDIISQIGDDSASALFDAWETDHAYKLNDRVSYNGLVYRCVQSHTSQADWTPDAVPALWARIKANPDPSEPEEWVQPTGAQDAYAKGDKVKHNGKVWESDVDGNVWEPGAAGTETLWHEVVA